MKNREKYYFPKIYGLICPKSGLVRYVGTTKRYLSERLWRHLNPPKKYNDRKQKWINSLKKEGLSPKIILIEETTKTKQLDRESYWIDFYKWNDLFNMNSGGNKPPEMAGHNRIKLSDEFIEKLGKMPDYKLAEIVGVSKRTIQRNRTARGIKSYSEQTGNDGKFKKKRESENRRATTGAANAFP